MAHDSDDNGNGSGKAPEPKGTKYGFPRIDDQAPKAQLPAPASMKQDKAEAEAPKAAPVLRRVEHELAEPARLTASTHTGREILREQVEEGLALHPVKSEDLIKHDLLEAERPSALSRTIQLLAWTRLRLIGVIVGAACVVIAVIVVVALRCGGSAQEPELASGQLPGGTDQVAPTKPVDPAVAARPAADDYVVVVAAARKLVEQNFCQDAAKMLLPALSGKEPNKQSSEGFYLLGRALVCGGKERAGLAAYGRALGADASRYRKDKALLSDMSYLLTRDKLQEPTIRLVVEQIGKPAVEVMLAAATHDLQAVRSRAVTALEKLGEAAKVDWQTTLWLDLEQTPCDARPAVIQRVGQKLAAKVARKLLRAAARSSKHKCVRKQLFQQLAELSPKKK